MTDQRTAMAILEAARAKHIRGRLNRYDHCTPGSDVVTTEYDVTLYAEDAKTGTRECVTITEIDAVDSAVREMLAQLATAATTARRRRKVYIALEAE